MKDASTLGANFGKFQDPYVTAKGETRASVDFSRPETLWFNTGTLCNIECVNCYIESSPTNDRLVYLTASEVATFLDQIKENSLPIYEIGFTGGEPFMNPQILDMLEDVLSRGYACLVLTNAMRPMMRKRIKEGLERLSQTYGSQLTLRISLDHYTAEKHDEERGKGSYEITLQGMEWLRDVGVKMAIAGRTVWGDSDDASRNGYKSLFKKYNFDIDASSPSETVLFPEMDETVEVPEITTECWGILNKAPDSPMCASSRMVVKRKGAEHPVVQACTLLAYDESFEMGQTLAEAAKPVQLNHPHCAKFCVLGGASCS